MSDSVDNFWTPVVQAYEDSIEALEAARKDYSDAATKILSGITKGLSDGKLGAPAGSATSRPITGNAPGDRPGAAELEISVTSPPGVTIQLCYWFPGTWGGSTGLLRTGLYMDELPLHLTGGNTAEALRIASSAIGESLPGSAYNPEEHHEAYADTGSTDQWLRIATIGLKDRTFESILAESIKTGITLMKDGGLPATQLVAGYLKPVHHAYEGLAACHDPLLEHAKACKLEVAPKDKALGSWADNYYLQIQDSETKFWISVDPNRRRVIASSFPGYFASSLAKSRGTKTELVEKYVTMELASEHQLAQFDYPGFYLEVFKEFTSWLVGR